MNIIFILENILFGLCTLIQHFQWCMFTVDKINNLFHSKYCITFNPVISLQIVEQENCIVKTHSHTHIQKPKRGEAFVFFSMVYIFVFNEAIIYPWELGQATWPLQHCNKIFTRWFEGWRKYTSTKTSKPW